MNRHAILGLVLLAVLLLEIALPAQPGSSASTLPDISSAQDMPNRFAVSVGYADQEALNRAAGRLDIWEVDTLRQVFIAVVNQEQYNWLLQLGYTVQVLEDETNAINSPPNLPCYRDIAVLYSYLQDRNERYATLTELYDIGNSYENRDLWAIRVTNEAIPGPKPRLFVMANAHGRELITPEVGIKFLDKLLEGYGIDPNVTWVVDWHEVYIVVSANPDGHVKNETTQAYWRKNTHLYGSCSPSDIGVDINRNSSFKWAYDNNGSSGYACDDTYRGPSAASEPETQAIQNYVLTLFPDQRGQADTDPAPADATGIFITLHSYGNLLLWPWGYTYTQAPNSTQLAMFGTKMATFNNYSPGQSVGLYPTNGSTDDWAYGILGIASYTFEIGANSDGFYPSCLRYNSLVTPNLNALFYAAKVARTPYITSFGPDALNVVVSPASAAAGEPINLTATINDNSNGSQPIQAAEYSIDTPAWIGGSTHPMQATDGSFNQVSEAVNASVDTTGLSSGRHILYVRGKDAGGFWGPPEAKFITINAMGSISGTVSEYGSGHPLSALITVEGSGVSTYSDSQTGAFTLALPAGSYTLHASAPGYTSQTFANVNVHTGISTPLQVILPVDPQALELTLFGTAGPLSPGDPLTYTLSLTNTSSLTLTSVTISNTLPVGLGFASAETGGVLENGNVRWQIPSLIGGEGLKLSWQAAVKPGAPGILVNDAYSAHPLEMTVAVPGSVNVEMVRLKMQVFLPIITRQD